MDKYESIPLELPNKYIEASPGFALDIGCSTAKLVYRSKDDYKDGKPINKELSGSVGRVFLIPSIVRTELDDVIEIIRTKCDLRHPEDGTPAVVISTGAGCNLFRERLETELKISLTNAHESEYFTKAFIHIAKHLNPEDVFEPMDEKTTADVKKYETLMQNLIPMFADWGVDAPSSTPEAAGADKEATKSHFPCLIVMCGSGFAYLQVSEDGKFSVSAQNVFGGRAFLGLTALLTGEKDFAKILQAVERGSCRSVDEYAEDLVSMCPKEEKSGTQASEDSYNVMGEVPIPLFPFGKAVTKNRDEIQDDDILHSLYKNFLVNLVDLGRARCQAHGIKNIYFSGNFVQNPVARYLITLHNAVQNVMLPKDQCIEAKFIKNGGHLGAMGAFLKSYEAAEKSAATGN